MSRIRSATSGDEFAGRGAIARTIAQARAEVSVSAVRTASLASPSRPFTPALSRRTDSPLMRCSPSPTQSPTHSHHEHERSRWSASPPHSASSNAHMREQRHRALPSALAMHGGEGGGADAAAYEVVHAPVRGNAVPSAFPSPPDSPGSRTRDHKPKRSKQSRAASDTSDVSRPVTASIDECAVSSAQFPAPHDRGLFVSDADWRELEHTSASESRPSTSQSARPVSVRSSSVSSAFDRPLLMHTRPSPPTSASASHRRPSRVPSGSRSRSSIESDAQERNRTPTPPTSHTRTERQGDEHTHVKLDQYRESTELRQSSSREADALRDNRQGVRTHSRDTDHPALSASHHSAARSVDASVPTPQSSRVVKSKPTVSTGPLDELTALHRELLSLSADNPDRPDATRAFYHCAYGVLKSNKSPSTLVDACEIVLQHPFDAVYSKASTLCCRRMFEISKSAHHDRALLDLGPALARALSGPDRGLREISYLIGCLHNLSIESAHQSKLCSASMVHALTGLLDPSVIHDTLQLTTESEAVKLAVEVTAVIRNLACAQNAPDVLMHAESHTRSTHSDSCFTVLIKLLSRYPSHSSLVLNVLRVVSKLSGHPAARTSIGDLDGALEQLVALLSIHHTKLALCVRVSYVLGNMTMTNDHHRQRVTSCICPPPSQSCDSQTGLDVCMSLLDRSVIRDSKLRRLIAKSKTASDAGDSQTKSECAASVSKHVTMANENDDLCVKLIRLIANLSISPDIGASILADARSANLLPLLGTKSKTLDRHEELVLNIVSAITNLSFYIPAMDTHTHSDPECTSDSLRVLGQPCSDVVGALVPFVFSPNVELVSESCRALGNLSRHRVIRQHLRASRVDEAMTLLTGHSDAAVVYGAAGVLLNCTSDVEGRKRMMESDGETNAERCIETIERFGLTNTDCDRDEDSSGQLSALAIDVLSVVSKLLLNLRDGSGLLPLSSHTLRDRTVDVLSQLITRLEQQVHTSPHRHTDQTDSDEPIHQLVQLTNELLQATATDAD